MHTPELLLQQFQAWGEGRTSGCPDGVLYLCFVASLLNFKGTVLQPAAEVDMWASFASPVCTVSFLKL